MIHSLFYHIFNAFFMTKYHYTTNVFIDTFAKNVKELLFSNPFFERYTKQLLLGSLIVFIKMQFER